MARFPRHVNIIATNDPSKPDGVDFHMERPNGDKLESLVFSKDEDKMGKKDEHEIHFKLVQESGMTLEFAQNLDDALWVAWGDENSPPECPKTRPSTCPDPVFYAEKSPGNKLVAVNTNPSQQFFAFTLNFVDRTATGPVKLIPFDPIGENKNGGIGRSDPSVASATVTTVAVAVAVALVVAIGYALLT